LHNEAIYDEITSCRISPLFAAIFFS